MDRHSRPGPEPTTLEAVGDQWRYAFVVVQAKDDDDEEMPFLSPNQQCQSTEGRILV